MHKLSKQIVQLTKENNAVIVIGELSGIRERSKSKGKRFRARIARMPSYRLAQFIEYKAHWAGILVYGIDEAWSSKICHACGSIGNVEG